MSATKAVLYVEDAPTIRELSALALEDAGFEVVVAGNGTAALNALDDHAHTFCAVVTDVNQAQDPTAGRSRNAPANRTGHLPLST